MSKTLTEVISEAVTALVAQYRDSTADGKFSAEDAIKLTALAIDQLVAVVNVLGVPGADKKAAVVEGVRLFYDRVIAPLDIPGVPNWIEPAVDTAIGFGLERIVGGLIEAAVERIKDEPTIGATP